MMIAHRCRSRRGVTLIELVIVIVIIGIVASVGGLRYLDALAAYRVERAAQRLAAEIEAVRYAARSRGQTVTLTFQTAQDRLTITGLPNPDRKSAAYTIELAEASLPVDLTAASFGGDAILIFSGYGMPDSGGVLAVQSANRQKTVSVAAGTGAVTVP